ncbi:MAG: hypothetical protein AAGD43_26245, partial [Pseudomonadota bacterium]
WTRGGELSVFRTCLLLVGHQSLLEPSCFTPLRVNRATLPFDTFFNSFVDIFAKEANFTCHIDRHPVRLIVRIRWVGFIITNYRTDRSKQMSYAYRPV